MRKAVPRLAGAAILVGLCSTFQVTAVGYLFGGDARMSPILRGNSWLLTWWRRAWYATMLYVAITATRHALEMRLLLRESQLKALENQVNPHFLFNSLNTIRNA